MKKQHDPFAVERFFRTVLIVLIAIVAILAMALLSGCMSVEKATDYLKEKDKLAEVCAREFPPTGPEIEYRYGDTSAMTALRKQIDSLLAVVDEFEPVLNIVDTCDSSKIGVPVISEKDLKGLQDRIRILQTEIRSLKLQMQQRPPPDTVYDSRPFRYAMVDLQKKLETQTKRAESAEADASLWKKRAIWTWAILFLITVFWVLIKLYGKYIKLQLPVKIT